MPYNLRPPPPVTNREKILPAPSNYAEEAPPPNTIPRDLYEEYTMNNAIPVRYFYVNESKQLLARSAEECGGTSRQTSFEKYQSTIQDLERKNFHYYGGEINSFYDAFQSYSLVGKSVLIWGLAGCNCDAIALWQGASRVVVVDYNPLICDHPLVTALSHDQLHARAERFDAAFSYSSFEHDGLGRYGDPLNPNGDLEAMRNASQFLKGDGLLFFSVPLGHDCLLWNAFRIYGEKRLPLLLRDWNLRDAYYHPNLEKYRVHPDDMFSQSLGIHSQPLLVLEKQGGQSIYPHDIISSVKKTQKRGANLL
jgi:SAM-dependent methyltransferase